MKNVLVLLLTLVYFTSCSPEVDFVEPFTSDEVTENENNPDETEEEPQEVSTDPCDFSLENAEAGETIIIDCIMDLGGKTVSLPSDVTLEYDGGDIINGILNFNNGVIDGRLLNSKLEIKGTANLLDVTFEFNPKRWDIVEGKVSDAVARKNRDDFKSLISLIKKMGGTTFNIDKFDAYFKVDEPLEDAVPEQAAIIIPSDFNFIMSDNTHLRMQPNGYKQPTLLAVTNGDSNVLISGGNLHGDRDEHDYSAPTDHEWGHCLRLKSCSYVTVENVTILDATGDGIDIAGLGHAFNSDYRPSHNLIIRNNIIKRSRRNNISVTDGYDILIEGNELIDAGIHTAKSRGSNPGVAIDIEAVRTSEIAYEIARDIIIRGNIERGSRVVGFTVHTGDEITIEDNYLENGISYSTTYGTIIRNNTIEAVTDDMRNGGTAITAGRNDKYDKNYDNKVYGNTIIGYSGGIKMANTDLEVYENTIIDCKTGLVFESLSNSKVYGNNIKSTREDSDGIVTGPNSEYLNGITINNNTIEVLRTPLKFINVNVDAGQEDFEVVITKNIAKSIHTSTLSNMHGFSFIDNTINEGGLRLENVQKGTISANKITSTTSDGIRIDQGCKNIDIIDHLISINGNYECIKVNDQGENISIVNNTCM